MISTASVSVVATAKIGLEDGQYVPIAGRYDWSTGCSQPPDTEGMGRARENPLGSVGRATTAAQLLCLERSVSKGLLGP